MRAIRIVCFLIAVLWANDSFAERFLRAYTAEWCAPCQLFKRDMLAHPEIVAGYTVEIIDAGNDAELQKVKKISTFPTFIVEDNEKEIARLTGYTAPDFKAWTKTYRIKQRARH